MKYIDEDSTLVNFDKVWDYNDPANTEIKFNDLLSKAAENGTISTMLQIMTQIARSQGLQQKFEDAHKTLDKVENQLSPIPAIEHVRYYLERGRAYNSNGEKSKAWETFLAGLAIAEQVGNDFYTIDVLHMLAIVAPITEQLDWNLRALELAKSTPNDKAKGWLGSLYNNIGWTYHDLGEYEKALDIFKQALEYRNEFPNRKESIYIAEWCVAKMLRLLNRFEEALSAQQLLMEKYKLSGIEESGYVGEEIAECLLALGKTDESKIYFKEAYDKLSADLWLVRNQIDRLMRLKSLSE